MCWVLDADINLGGGTIKAVGRHATGFQGTLYGNKHVIKNGTVQYETWIDNTTQYAVGLFHKINGGKVYDFNIDSTIKYTMNTSINVAPSGANCRINTYQVYIGGLAAVSVGGTFVGINSKANISFAQTGTTVTTCAVGGLLGHTDNTQLYKSSFQGSVYYKTGTGHTTVNGDTHEVGGLIGNCGLGTFVIDQCAVSGSVVAENNGANVGGLLGRPYATTKMTVTNCIIDTQVKMLGPSGTNVNDCALIAGEDMFQSVRDCGTVSKCENIYILGNAKVYRGSSDTTGGIYLVAVEHGSNSDLTDKYNAAASNIVVPVNSSTAVYPAYVEASTKNNKAGSVSGVVSSANSNPAISNNYTLTNAGGITSKTVSSGHIAFIKGATR